MIAFRMLGKYGRLGNQLFQIAATLGIARAHGVGAGFSPWEHDACLARPLPPIPQGFEGRIFQEADFRHSEVRLDAAVDWELRGYFQSERYFNGCKEDVLRDLAFSSNHIGSVRERFGHLLKGETCSLHVRRGDYLKSAIHKVLPVDYYALAVSMLPEATCFLVFSDDPDWCRRELSFIRDARFMECGDPLDDLTLMSLCAHNIVANSSFSWWGAYLNYHPGRRVLAPHSSECFEGLDCSTYVPDSYIQIRWR